MGTWAVPYTDVVVSRLEALMSVPLRADAAADVLYGVVGDDTLFDMLHGAALRDPAADVRPLVAMTLDEWTNWQDPQRFSRSEETDPVKRALNWDAGCRERLRTLAGSFPDVGVGSIVDGSVAEDSVDGARACYAPLLSDPSASGDLRIAKTQVPGVYAVLPVDGPVSRVEIVYGVVTEADEGVAEALRATYFGAQPLPSPAA